VLSPFILLLSDLLSGVLLEALGVELELVSWLCARADDAASARANTDNAVNLIGKPPLVVYAKVGDAGARSQRTTPGRRANRTSVPHPVGPKHEEPDPSGSGSPANFGYGDPSTPRMKSRSHKYASRSGS
jgi:hypothetical protein